MGNWVTISTTDTAQGCRFAVWTTPNGTVLKYERMTVDQSGYVGIGRVTPTTMLDVNGTVTATQFSGSGAGLTSIPISGLSAGDYSGKVNTGTYSISISGNAATVTSGVYTSGSYSDPSWLSISKTKVGLSAVENTALSTWAGTSNITTVGTLSAGTVPWSLLGSVPSNVTNAVSTGGSYSDPSWLSISKTKVGLSAVENTALSTWAGSANLTTLGVITIASGNVGIGTVSPGVPFEVVTNNGTGSTLQATTYDNGAGVSSSVVLRRARGTIASPTAIDAVRGLATIQFQGYDGAAFGNASVILAATDGAWTTSDHSASLQFYTTAALVSSEKMRITSAGYVGIGTTTPGTALAVTGTVTASGSLVAGGTSSIYFTGRSAMWSTADGNIGFANNAETAFGLMQLGGTTASFPAIKRNAAALNFRLADDSADAAITAGALTLSGTWMMWPSGATIGLRIGQAAAANNIQLRTNVGISYPASGAGQDDVSLPSYAFALGGSGDNFAIYRMPPAAARGRISSSCRAQASWASGPVRQPRCSTWSPRTPQPFPPPPTRPRDSCWGIWTTTPTTISLISYSAPTTARPI
jgi:hypothetical protein